MKQVMFDPPDGWRYGFPKMIPHDADEKYMIQLLRNSKYPEKDIEFAMKHSRYMYVNSSDVEEQPETE